MAARAGVQAPWLGVAPGWRGARPAGRRRGPDVTPGCGAVALASTPGSACARNGSAPWLDLGTQPPGTHSGRGDRPAHRGDSATAHGPARPGARAWAACGGRSGAGDGTRQVPGERGRCRASARSGWPPAGPRADLRTPCVQDASRHGPREARSAPAEEAAPRPPCPAARC